MQSLKLIRTILLVFIITVSQTVRAICPNATYLNVGDVVKDCPRIGLSTDYDLEVRKSLIEGDFNKKIIQGKDDLLGIKETQIMYLTDQSELWKKETLRERAVIDSMKKDSKYDFYMGILLGAGSILLGAWSIQRVR